MNRKAAKKVRVNAIKDSIKHWKEMISWVKKQSPGGVVNKKNMNDDIKQDWYGDNCALCIVYEDTNCIGCPLYTSTISHCCKQWHNVSCASTWKEWLKYAAAMLRRLNAVLKREER